MTVKNKISIPVKGKSTYDCSKRFHKFPSFGSRMEINKGVYALSMDFNEPENYYLVESKNDFTPSMMSFVTISSAKPYLLRGSKRENYNTNLYTSNDKKYTFYPPIPVNVVFEDGEFIASIDKLDLFSYSENYNEVIEEINDEVMDVYLDLIELPEDKLGKHPKNWLNYLNKRIYHIHGDRGI